MYSSYPAKFEREMGCTEADWRRWLPAALGEHKAAIHGSRAAVDLMPGSLLLSWSVGAPRVIGEVRIPRLHVEFEFADVPPARRTGFMQRFDLYLQRGGG